MLYYKVKKESDNIKYYIRTKKGPMKYKGFLVANELYTRKEISKKRIPLIVAMYHMEPVQISKKQTYFFFGARFQNSAA